MRIRQSTSNDIPALAALSAETYSDAFGHTTSANDLKAHLAANCSEDYFRKALPHNIVLLAEEDGRLIGYTQFGDVGIPVPGVTPDDQELKRMYVHHSMQKRKIGAALLEAALAHPRLKNAGTIFLGVWEHNLGAQKFYARYGFIPVDEYLFPVASGTPSDREIIMVRRS